MNIPENAEGIFLGDGIEPYLFIKKIGKKCYLPLVTKEDEQNERGSKKAVVCLDSHACKKGGH